MERMNAMDKHELYLVLGGARSGKSAFAEEMARAAGKKVIYIATSEVLDEEMALRVKHHRERRPADWFTVEEPLSPEAKIDWVNSSHLVLLDCLTLWVSNLLLHKGLPYPGSTADEKEAFIIQKVTSLLNVLQGKGTSAILVSNEVGWSIVPENPLARQYRDVMGRVNQLCARRAKRVFLAVAGLVVEIKSLAIDEIGGAGFDC